MPKAVRVAWITETTHAETFLVPDDFDLSDYDSEDLWGYMFDAEFGAGLPENDFTEVCAYREIQSVRDAE